MRMCSMIFLALPLLIATQLRHVEARPLAYSWGKPGVSKPVYDADAIACSLQAASRDVANDQETQRYVQGREVLERENNMPPMARPAEDDTQANRNVLLRRMYSPDRKVGALQAKLQSEVESCLVSRGYIRFLLSREQSKQLGKLKIGSRERGTFLHGLGSNAGIIARQRVDFANR